MISGTFVLLLVYCFRELSVLVTCGRVIWVPVSL